MMTRDAVEIDPINKERREKVKDAMRHAWSSYVTYAWGQDELQVCYILKLLLPSIAKANELYSRYIVPKHLFQWF